MNDKEIVNDFLAESYENLDRLDRDLVGLEKNPKDKEALAGIFRTIHTVKGTCGFLGFNKLENVAHVGENLLSRLRDGHLHLSPELTTQLLNMVDAIRQMLKEIASTGQDGENDYPELRERLTQLLASPGKESGCAPQTVAQLSTAVEIEPETGGELDAPASSAKNRTSLSAEAQASVPTHDEPINRSPKKNANSKRKPSRGKIGGVLVELGQARAEDIALALEEQEKGDRRKLGEILVALGFAKQEDVLAAQHLLEGRSRDTAPETIRVGVNLLDRLMTLVGELVLARNQLLQVAKRVADAGLENTSQRMNLIATELQEEVMKTRMQPIGVIWAQFPRTVRDVALGCGKEVDIEMEGKETELDKTIIEAIKDPLTHLVRNSVDHGIESPETRVQAGKPRSGRLILRAFHEGGQVNIEISDDGAGLNAERIRKKAIERELISSEQAERMTERETFNLIFQPGFSTAEKITNVSGRGVGMDVVKTNVEKIGGTVDIQSSLGRGTTVRVRIPLTLAIIPALVVSCCGERYAIPQVNLLELVRLEVDDVGEAVELVHGAPVYRLRGRLLPLVYLSRELNLVPAADTNSENDGAVNIVVLQAGERQFGLVVDQINDSEEIVVKPLRKQLRVIKTFAGSSIMGDGKVALILDVLGLAQRAGVVTETRDRAVENQSAESQTSQGEKQTFLLFAGPSDSRMAIPLSTLARLEEFPASQVETSGGQWVTQYRGQILPLIRMNVLMGERRGPWRAPQGPPPVDSGPIHSLILNHENRSYGLVVEKILDIIEDRATVKSAATRPFVLYSAVIGNRVTELLDIPSILRKAEAHAMRATAAMAGG